MVFECPNFNRFQSFTIINDLSFIYLYKCYWNGGILTQKLGYKNNYSELLELLAPFINNYLKKTKLL